MADKTKISWADATWNPIIGCSKISAGCANCYAERMAHRLACMGRAPYQAVLREGKWNNVTAFSESTLTKPLHWRKPRKIFVCSMSDLFHESVPKEWLHKVFTVMESVPRHQFMLLTKRSKEMREYVSWRWSKHRIPSKHIHLGVTVENQDNVGRMLDLVKTPRAEGFISFEPLLGRIDCPKIDAPGRGPKNVLEDISYVFIGCESGSGARLCTQEDIRHVMRQCRVADVKIHVKQIPLNGKCNKVIGEWPKEFQVREV